MHSSSEKFSNEIHVAAFNTNAQIGTSGSNSKGYEKSEEEVLQNVINQTKEVAHEVTRSIFINEYSDERPDEKRL